MAAALGSAVAAAAAAMATTTAPGAAAAEQQQPPPHEEEEHQPAVWAPYVVKSIDFGQPHPGRLVEASVLAATALPAATYPVHDSLQTQIDNGTLSNVQLEGIVYASQRFQTFTPNSEKQLRSGFLIADAAGVGKGRQIAGLILDNLVRNRTKHCWFSVSQDLHLDATRDLREIGCQVSIVKSIADLHVWRKSNNGSGRGGGGGREPPCVVFSTYAGLISKHRGGGGGNSNKTRMQELVEWLTADCTANEYEGVIVFDEAHKAKNFKFEGSDSTQVGRAVYELQMALPKARVLYSSATMVSDVSEMAYMTRLGYWGPNCMYASFDDFKAVMESLDVSGMELLAVDMKATGRAVVRNVSYEGAEFRLSTADLVPQDARLYRDACAFWADLLTHTRRANSLCHNSDEYESAHKSAGSLYWSAHQRFFAQLILSLKVNKCVEEVQRALDMGMAAVIGLQTTGGAALSRSMADDAGGGGGDGGDLDVDLGDMLVAAAAASTTLRDGKSAGIISMCRSVAMLYVTTQFPVKRVFTAEHERAFYQPTLAEVWVEIALLTKHRMTTTQEGQKTKTLPKHIRTRILEYVYEDDAGLVDWPMYRENGDVVECVRMRDQLVARLDQLQLPPGALDTLIDRLGGKDKVAEMTGRTSRQVRCQGGQFEIEKRIDYAATPTPGGSSEIRTGEAQWWADENTAKSNSVNVQEKQAFLNDLKHVAIISSAASTGISLHADRAVKNKRRRFHITLELPWAGDQAVQQLGRSHRTNQQSAPLFCLLSSGLGGENRFVSSVARRLQSLGALTQGDRRASLGAMSFGELQYESKYGTSAVKAMYKHTLRVARGAQPTVVPGVDWNEVVAECRLQIDLDCAGGMPPGSLATWPLAKCTTQAEFLQVVADGLHSLDVDTSKLDANKRLVKTFLNRILGLPVLHQTLLFTYFSKALDASVLAAKKLGQYNEGFKQLNGKVEMRNAAGITQDDVLYTDSFGRSTVIYDLKADTSFTFDEAICELQYRLCLAQGATGISSPDDLAVQCRNMTDEDIEALLVEAKTLQVGEFHYKPGIQHTSDPSYNILLTFGDNKPVVMNGRLVEARLQGIRPVNRTTIYASDLMDSYAPYRPVKRQQQQQADEEVIELVTPSPPVVGRMTRSRAAAVASASSPVTPPPPPPPPPAAAVAAPHKSRVQLIREQWALSLNGASSRRNRYKLTNLVGGNLLPILGDLNTLQQRRAAAGASFIEGEAEPSRAPPALEAYIVETYTKKERLFGIKMKDLAQVRSRLKQRTVTDRISLTPSAPLRVGDLLKHDFGFAVDAGTYLVKQVTKPDLGVQVGMRLVSFNTVQLSPGEPLAAQLHKLAKFAVIQDCTGVLPESKPNVDDHVVPKMMFEFVRQSTLGDHLQGAEAPGKISFTSMDKLNVDPKRAKSSKEKLQKKMKKLFDTDSEDEAASAAAATPKSSSKTKKAKMSSSSAASAAATPKTPRAAHGASSSSSSSSAPLVPTFTIPPATPHSRSSASASGGDVIDLLD